MEQMAKAIYDWCIENEMWQYVIIYFDGKAWSSYKRWGGEEGRRIGDRLFEYEDKNPLDYFEYANPATLSMSFEGELYDMMNNGWFAKELESFSKLINGFGYYYELGNAWNLSLYKIFD